LGVDFWGFFHQNHPLGVWGALGGCWGLLPRPPRGGGGGVLNLWYFQAPFQRALFSGAAQTCIGSNGRISMSVIYRQRCRQGRGAANTASVVFMVLGRGAM